MKKAVILLGIILGSVLLAGFSSTLSVPAVSNSDSPTPKVTESPAAGVNGLRPVETAWRDDEIRLSSLNAGLIRPLQGSYDRIRWQFALPPEWQLLPGARLELDLTSYLSSLVLAQGEMDLKGVVAGTLQVSLNNVDLQPLLIEGNVIRTFSVPIPPEALQPDPLTTLHTLEIYWDGSLACEMDMTTSVVIEPTSRLILPHQTETAPVDLSSFPSPIYVENSPIEVNTSLVLPDEATAGELQAALSVMAGLGRLTQGRIQINMISVSKLSDEQRHNNHLILVGKPSDFAGLAASLRSWLVAVKAESAEDGLVRMTLSPWNTGRVILLVSGEEDEGIIKAALAVSSAKLLTADGTDLAYIRDVALHSPLPVFAEDQTFAMLGQPEQIVTNFGSSTMSIDFDIPADNSVGPEAYLDLVFNHSGLIDYLRSAIIVRLNHIPLGGVRLSDATANINVIRFMLPYTALRSGRNQLEIQVDLFPRDICSDPRLGSLWIAIFPDSRLHLPLVNQPRVESPVQAIGDFPHPFIGNDELRDTLFVLPAHQPLAWELAGELAFYLGSHTRGDLSAPQVVFTDALSQIGREGAHLILIGELSSLPFLEEWGGVLPVPLNARGEIVGDVKPRVTFQVSPQVGLGYLELGHLPGQAKTILAVLGTSPDGLRMAARALTQASMSKKLARGNFAVLQGRTVLVEQIQAAAGEESAALPGEAGGVSPTLPTSAEAEEQEQVATFSQPEGWILPAMIASAGLILIVLGMQVNHVLRRRKR